MKNALKKLKNERGKWEKHFDDTYDENTGKFYGHDIKKRARDEASVMNFKQDYLKSILEDLNSRTEKLTDEMKSFKLLTKINQNTDIEEILFDCKTLCAKLKRWNLDEAKLVQEVMELKSEIKNETLEEIFEDNEGNVFTTNVRNSTPVNVFFEQYPSLSTEIMTLIK